MEENGPREETCSALKMGLGSFEQGILGPKESKPGLEALGDQEPMVESPGQELLLPVGVTPLPLN